MLSNLMSSTSMLAAQRFPKFLRTWNRPILFGWGGRTRSEATITACSSASQWQAASHLLDSMETLQATGGKRVWGCTVLDVFFFHLLNLRGGGWNLFHLTKIFGWWLLWWAWFSGTTSSRRYQIWCHPNLRSFQPSNLLNVPWPMVNESILLWGGSGCDQFLGVDQMSVLEEEKKSWWSSIGHGYWSILYQDFWFTLV